MTGGLKVSTSPLRPKPGVPGLGLRGAGTENQSFVPDENG